uniref:SCP domain-containing protein n=1 Tax=Strongyloides papillosus TaxID=174720 RepID=A0A0N5BVD3_STREA
MQIDLFKYLRKRHFGEKDGQFNKKINELRTKNHAEILKVDDALTKRAQKHVEESAEKRVDNINNESAGVSFHIAESESKYDPLSMWTSESTVIDYDNLENGPTPKRFTQLICISTTNIGCGLTDTERENNEIKYLKERQADKKEGQNEQTIAEIKNNKKKVIIKKPIAGKNPRKRPPFPRPPARRTTPRRPPLRRTTPRRPPARRTTPRRPPGRRTTPRRPPARRTTPRRPPGRRTTPRKPPGRRTTPRRPPLRRTTPRRPPIRKTTARKPPARRTLPRRPPPRKTTARRLPTTRPPIRKTTARRTSTPRSPNKRPQTRKPGHRQPLTKRKTKKQTTPKKPSLKPLTIPPTRHQTQKTITTTTTTTTITATTTTLKPDEYARLKSQLIIDINNLRLKHKAKELIVNTTLANQAQKVADDIKNILGNIDNSIGWLLNFAGLEDESTPSTERTAESENIVYGKPDGEPVPEEVAQLVWASTTDIGCGISKIDTENIMVSICMFYPHRKNPENNVENNDSVSLDLIRNDLSSKKFAGHDSFVHSKSRISKNNYLRKRQIENKGVQREESSFVSKKSNNEDNKRQARIIQGKKFTGISPLGIRPPYPRHPNRKPPIKRTTPRRPPVRRTTIRRPPVRRTTTRRPPIRRTTTRRSSIRRTTIRRPPNGRPTTKKLEPRPTLPKRSTKKQTTPKTTLPRPPVRPSVRPPLRPQTPKPTTTKRATTTTRSTTTTVKPDKYAALIAKTISDINNLRLKHQAEKLTVSATLAKRAQKIADESHEKLNDINDDSIRLIFYHARSEREFDPLSFWTIGIQDIDYNDLNERTVPLDFAQLVWVSSKEIGCGISELKDNAGILTICLFSPKGGIPGQYPENIRRPIS